MSESATRGTAEVLADQATGFQLAVTDEVDAGSFGPVLAPNRAFAEAGGHEGAVVFPKLRLFVVTCLDPAHVLGLELSEAIVVRNVGGRITPAVINDVAFISELAENLLPDRPLFEVALIHHTQCGAGALADDTFRQRYAQRICADESTLRERAVLDPTVTVASDVERICSAASISPRVAVSGHVYDVVTGLVQAIVPAGAEQSVEQPNPLEGDEPR